MPSAAGRRDAVDECALPRLVDRAGAGDPDAWEALYRRIYPRLRAYVAARVPGREVDDVVNETMTRAVGGLDRFQWQPSGFDAWLFRIARNISADYHRAAFRSRRTARIRHGSAATTDPSDAIELAEDHARIRAAFAMLPAKERDLLELRFIAGLSADEIAIALGKRAGAVRTAQSRALARLRTLLDQQP